MKNLINNPDFELIDECKIDYFGYPKALEVYKNEDGQFLTTGEDYETGNKTITFHPDFDHLASVFSGDIEVKKIETWKNISVTSLDRM